MVAYIKLYAFLSEVMPFQDVDLEKLYTFGRFLRLRLPVDRGDPLKVDDDAALKYAPSIGSAACARKRSVLRSPERMMSVDSKGPPDRTLDPHDTARVNLREGLRLWVTANFARSWYNDAMSEVTGNLAAAGSTHRDRVRREILFAVCLAETYLFEWVRDSVLKHDYEKLNQYFPPIERKRPKMPVRERWREVPKQLASNGLLSTLPRWTAEQDMAWKRLVDYRNGLVHATASRPDTKGLGNGENPSPGPDELDQVVKRGWALGVVIDRIRGLHQAAGTELPSWLQRPRVE